ncbi:MAG: STAS domain-containing protein [Candidatus Krumholzibacteriia bacterium]
MFDIQRIGDHTVVLSGRLDASQATRAREVFEGIDESSTVDLRDLEYVSSAGLGILVSTQLRLAGRGERLTLVNPTSHVRELLHITGLDAILQID